MLVAIPSKGRAAQIKSHKRIPSATVFVPASESSLYRSAKIPNVVSIPNAIRGITRTRNWILDWASRKSIRRVVFIDDDLRTAGWIELMETFVRVHSLKEPELLREWERLFDLVEQMKFRLFGVANISAPRAVYPWRPFIFHTYVTASCMGIINDDRLRFDESFPIKEDYELCLRCIREDGGVLGARYLFWENEHWVGRGGCATYRTQEMEMEAIQRLMQMYPGMIRRVKRGGSSFSIDLDFPTL